MKENIFMFGRDGSKTNNPTIVAKIIVDSKCVQENFPISSNTFFLFQSFFFLAPLFNVGTRLVPLTS
jgi:hypothetical protein